MESIHAWKIMCLYTLLLMNKKFIMNKKLVMNKKFVAFAGTTPRLSLGLGSMLDGAKSH